MKNNDVTDLSGIFAQDRTATPQSVPLSMADFDENEFRSHLDGLDISDEQASELMRIVWDIMRMWVEMDLPADSCGQIVESIINPIPGESDSLD